MKEARGYFHTLLLKVLTTVAMLALSACTWNATTGDSSPKASAELLDTRIFVHQGGKPAIQRVEFDVPRTGKATLRLANGAKLDARPQDRVTSAIVRLNGEEIAESSGFNKQKNILYLPVELKAGRNVLSVELRGQSGQRISARIDAPPDSIQLALIPETLAVGKPLQARAMLTGRGRPVPGAAIEFSVEGLGKLAKQTAVTGRAGVAMITLRDFQQAGSGRLTAKTVGGARSLSTTVPLQVVESPSIAVETMARVALAPGTKRKMPFFIHLLDAEAKRSEITFEQTVEPDNAGINLTPSASVVVTPEVPESSRVLVDGMLEAFRSGTYYVTARATNKQTGETASARLEVNVIAPEPSGVLVLDPPAFIPAAVTVSKTTPVRFAAVARGVTHYPESLELQEFDSERDRWKKVPDGDLLDNGRNGDLIAGDQVYARRLTVIGTQEGDRRYRVVSSQKHKLRVSDSRVLKITRFPVGAAKGEFEVLKDHETGREFVAEQVTAGFLRGLSEERIQKIVESATRDATGQAGHVIGYLPQIHVVQVALVVEPGAPDDARSSTIKAAVAELERYDEVRHAQPNFVFEFAELPEVTPDGVDSTQCSGHGEQWAATRINAHKAWPITGTLKGKKVVALVDTGVKPSSDSTGDLCWGESMEVPASERDPVGCDPVNVIRDTDLDPCSDDPEEECSAEHGTAVAGIIAARHHRNNADGSGAIGISGIAHGLPIISFDVGDSLFTDETERNTMLEFAADFITAADTLEVGIINVSVADSATSCDFPCAIEYAAACPGDPPSVPFTCDCGIAGPTRCRLVVAAAGAGIDPDTLEVGVEIPTSGPHAPYPCATDLPTVLCVAGTNQSNEREMSNYGAVVDLSAPGAGVCTTSAKAAGGFTSKSGTSLAVPHVAGAAAVLWSKKGEDLDFTAKQVAERLKNKARLWGPEFKPSYVGEMGTGLLDLHAAVRYPARLVLVLDKSGSMAWSSRPFDHPECSVHAPPVRPECEPSRWEVLNQAVEAMLTVAGQYAQGDDEFAVAYFDSSVGVVNRLALNDRATVDVDEVIDFVTDAARTPGGWTSIGAGMEAFKSELDIGASNYNQTILLFTDGDQNMQPYLVTDGSQVRINQTENLYSGTTEADKFPHGTAICPYVLLADNPSGPLGTAYLQSIAELRCDQLMYSATDISPESSDLQQHFLQVLHDALIGDKLELVRVTSGLIRRRANVSASETFTTSRDDLVFTVLITWSEPGNGIKEAVLSKDGVDFPVTGAPSRIRTSNGETYMAITLRRPFCRDDGKCVKSEGEWTLNMQPYFEGTDRFSYNVFVTADNSSLASEFRVLQPEPGVGRPLRVTASLTEAGKPIRGLPPGSVRAVLSRPRASLGNVLSKARLKPVQIRDADPISAAGRKASAMLAEPKLRPTILAALEPSVETELILEESKPGLYEASYEDTRVSGIYSVRFHVNGKSAGNGLFTRTFNTARSVEVMADGRATLDTVRLSKITPCRLAGGCYAITLTPVDAAGNLLGPGKASLIKLPRFSGRILNPISDELDGRYTIRIGYPKGSLEAPMIDILGAGLRVELGKPVK